MIQNDRWVWVVVQDPGDNEQFLGQRDEAKGISFIPVWLEKDAALDGLRLLARDRGIDTRSRPFNTRPWHPRRLKRVSGSSSWTPPARSWNRSRPERIRSLGGHRPMQRGPYCKYVLLDDRRRIRGLEG